MTYRSTLVLALSLLMLACPDEGRMLGQNCAADSECTSGFCAETCLDPNGDLDGDGVSNRIEVSLGSNPRAADSDGDGVGDQQEWGGNPNSPMDSDDDGKLDINESFTLDSDGDCISDQEDPIDDTFDALVEGVCSTIGVCEKPLLALRCSGSTLSCDYSAVTAYTLVDQCNGLDDDCDGSTDEDAACDDENACTDDACGGVNGCASQPNTIACDDGDACTPTDSCSNGACTGSGAQDCNDDNPCTDDVCDAASGCQNFANTVACDDGDACTTGEACSDGVCTDGAPADCDDDNTCTDDSCDALSGCQNVPDDAGTCDDGNLCTTGDFCLSGSCAGDSIDCNDNDPCTDDSCDSVLGCQNVPNTAPCDDGSACTTGDFCLSGSCSGESTDCNDNNPCTDDSCDSALGCQNVPNTAACDDGSVCTTGDFCLSGGCTGDSIDCNDGDPCTADTCDADLGCQSSLDVGATCDDGNACTQAECQVSQKSASSCEALGWVNAAGFGDPTVCGESDVPTCAGDQDHAGASATCAAVGARLCTLREVSADETSSTGCGLNSVLVWTASPCEDGASAWVRTGASIGGTTTECRALTEVAGVRCCADTEASDVAITCEAVAPACTGAACSFLTCDPAVGCTVETVTCDDGDICTVDTCSAYAGCSYVPQGCDSDGDGVSNAVDVDDDDPNVCRDEDADGCDDCSVTGADLSGGDVANDGADLDGDGVCDFGDSDIDDDTIPNEDDNCPRFASLDQTDSDTDTVGDVCDNCLIVMNTDQIDVDGDGVGWACETPKPTVDTGAPKGMFNFGHCPPGSVVSGFIADTGAFHDDLDFPCREVLSGGVLGNQTATVGYAGSPGGGTIDAYPCPANEVVVGFSVRTTNTFSAWFYRVESHCYPVATVQAGSDNSAAPKVGDSFVFNPATPVDLQAFCPDGQAMTGFGGYGRVLLNWPLSLSLFCAAP